jgi:hypothetical protein
MNRKASLKTTRKMIAAMTIKPINRPQKWGRFSIWGIVAPLAPLVRPQTVQAGPDHSRRSSRGAIREIRLV